MAESWADQYLRDANATARGRVSTIPAVTTSPDRQAEYDKLAKRFYVPPSVVENDPERFQRRAAVEDAQAHIDTAPKLGQWLGGDPQRAKMTHDSLDAMAGVEHMIDMTFGALRSTASRLPVAQPFPTNGTDADKLRYWREHNPGQGSITTPPTTAQVILAKLKNTTSTLYAGAQGLESTLSYAGAMAFSNVLGEQSTLYKTAMGHAIEAKSKQQQTSRSSFGGPWERALYQGVESLPTAGFAIGAGLLTGGWADSVLAGSVVGASAGGLAQAGSNYGEARQAGLTHEQATDYAMRGFLEETGTELLPISHTLKALQFNSPLGKRVRELAIGQLEEQFGEQAASHIEDFDKWATIEANQGKSFADYLAERPDVAFQTAVATAVGSLAIGGVATVKHALDTAKAKTQRKEQQVQRSQRTEALLTGLKELAEAAPIAKRDVSTFESWVRSAAEGTQATDVYIDARTLVETLQQSGLTEPEIVAALPSIRTELPTALLANGDVRIPIEEFAARSGELGQSLIPHLRLDPNDMSTSEAQTFMQSAQDEFQKETEKAFAEINADDQFRQSTERVADTVYEKLNQAGRFTPDTNRAYASLHAAFFARLASDLGTTPEEAAARYPLLIQSEGVGEGPGVMDQPQEADEAAAPQVFDQGERAPPALYPAIRHNGKIYKSVSDHLSALSQIPDPAERAKASADGDNRVYVTERGKVLDRFRAQEYAQAHDLISPDAPSWARTSPDLISENLRKPGRYYADTPREGYDRSGQPLPATIEVDGKQRSTVNSKGQPLAATEEGVRAFWDWFGDSKVVDEQGRPLVVYHGTAADFDQFSKAADAKHIELPGFFFTHDPSIAERFAASASRREFRDDDGYIAGYEGAAVVPVYLSIKNPTGIDLTDAETGKMTRESDVRGMLVAAQKAGHDGAIIRGWADGSGDAQYVAFSPSQIKSIHNRGTFDPNDPRILYQKRHGFEINDKLAEAAAGGFPLFQGPRGQIRVGDVTQDPTVITLLQRADLSTFLHESGHFFLEVLMHVAAQPNAPQRVVDDMNAFLKWTGVESMGQWSKMTTSEKREHHERFARGFEAFLYEGNAPSLELKSLFQRFRDWLLTVYRSLTQLNVELNPEVRGIFNRMLASDQAIREAEQQVGYEPILTEKPEGMDDGEWEAYQRLGQEATTEAVTDLERRSLRDMRYAGKAAGRELKRLQREIKDMREAMRTEVEADLALEPVYRAQEFMKKGMLNGEAVEGPTKMLLSEVEALYEDRPKLYVDEVKKALGFGQYGMLAKDGIHPEQIAELFGFTSADHMIQDLMLAEPFKKAVETEIDTRMLERYGDITSEKALQDAVDAAIHNDVRGRFVATEFAALSKAPGKPRVMAAAARSLAEKAVSRLKVRNLRPAQYEAAERRAAKAAAEASAKGDIPLAASEKRNQLINFYGAKASHDALADVDKMVRYFKKFEAKGTRQNLDTGYLDQIDKLLERFDLRKSVTNKQADRRKSLKAWVDRQKEMGFDPLIDEELLDEANRIPYREMTVEEMRGLRDTIKNIEHLARLKKKLLLAKDQREFADAVSDVAGAIRANAYKNVTEIIGAKTWWERVQSGIHDFFAMHRKMANWAHVMDGNKMGGPVWERFIRPMNERGAWEASAKAKATADLGALFDRLKGQNLNKRSFIPAIGKSLSLQDRLMVALNMGNEGNLQRLMDGERWEQDKLNAVLEPLTQEHWAFVQAVWDYLDSFYPEVAAKEVRVSGVAPQKVEAVPFERQLADGSMVQMRGGYFPIKYDPARSSRAEADTAAEVLQQMTQGRYTAAQTRRGHTKARAEQVDRPVRKDFGVIFEHVNQVIHDLAWHEYLIDANRLLRAVDIDTAIREAHGPETLRWMRKVLEDIALGDIPAQSSFEQVINHVRAGASVAAMGWNLWTSMMQSLGLTQSASRIGTRWVLKGMSRIMGDAAHMESAAQWVYERSEFMRNRGTTQQREIAEIRSKVSDKSPLRKTVELAVPPHIADAVTDSFFILIAKAQLIADLPTWIGQYEKSMAAGETEERAAALADQAVLDSQGGGQIKDMAGIQRGGALMKLWTNFYGYFNTTYNLMADRTAQLRREGVRDLPAFAVDQLMLSALPSILTTLLYQLVKGDDDDWENLPKQMAEDFFGYMTGLMVGLREIGAVLNPHSSYQGPAGARVFSEINKFGKQVQQGEGDEALARSANQLGGILFHYPATQIDRTARGIAALEQGEAGPLAPVVGPPVDR